MDRSGVLRLAPGPGAGRRSLAIAHCRDRRKSTVLSRVSSEPAPTGRPVRDRERAIRYSREPRRARGSHPRASGRRSPVPVPQAAVGLVEPRLVLASEGPGRVVLRAVLDGVAREVDKDLGLLPGDPRDPVRRHEDVLARPPVARADFHVANGPRAILDEEVLDVADVAVGGLDVVAGHGAGAPEVWITLRHGLLHRWQDRRPARRKQRIGLGAPRVGTGPVVGIAVVARVLDLVLAIDGDPRVDAGAVFDLL